MVFHKGGDSFNINFHNISLLEPISLLNFLRVFVAIIPMIAHRIARITGTLVFFLFCLIDNSNHYVSLFGFIYFYCEFNLMAMEDGAVEDIVRPRVDAYVLNFEAFYYKVVYF